MCGFLSEFGKKRLFFDGAMGTMLQQKGLAGGEIPELWNIRRFDDVKDVHSQYLLSGADIIETNTFGANSIKLKDTGFSVGDIISAAVLCVKKACEETSRKAWCALSLGSLGKLLQPLGELSFDEAYDIFKEAVVSGEKHGCDLILLETMTDMHEIKAAVLAAKENTSLPVLASMAFDTSGKLLTGADVLTCVTMLEGLGADGIGINCTAGPEHLYPVAKTLSEVCSLPFFVNPNADLPKIVDGKTVYELSAEEFGKSMKNIALLKASALGGCCGTTPKHIFETVSNCKDMPFVKNEDKEITSVCSYNRTVIIGKKPVIIGERINPTGRKDLRAALVSGDVNFAVDEALKQQDCGADILDVNAGCAGIDEAKTLCSLVKSIQELCPLPLQIDTTDFKTMEKALRAYNGKPLINSTNGKKEIMEKIFPLAKKYGGVVVCLTLDERGIPETAEERLEIAKNIIKTAESYGISKKDLIIDPLAATVSTGRENALVTLEALELIKSELRVNTVLGVSNISYGLPNRENLNSSFLTLALSRGLSAAIINPESKAMTDAFSAYCCLGGVENGCEEYIRTYSNSGSQTVSDSQTSELQNAVIKGLTENAVSAIEKLFEKKEPLDIIDSELMPALEKVGESFEKGGTFLPELLASSDAAKAAFEKISERISASGSTGQKKGRVILATVKGDIHDIGKNIVKTLLEAYGFDVLDLGKDVSGEEIVSAALANDIKLIGLSALMTTTALNMGDIIKLIREKCPERRVMVGGAALSQEFADKIGADFYGKDAIASAKYALSVFGEQQKP